MLQVKKPEHNLPPAQPLSSATLLNIIKKANKILLLAGKPIDGDSLASALAFQQILAKLNVKSDVASGDAIPESLRFLSNEKKLFFTPDFLKYDLVIVFDCGELKQTGFLEQLLKILQTRGLAKLINIDHHIQDPVYGHYSFIDSDAAATGMLVYRLAKDWQVDVDEPIAANLLATLYHDTGSFQHSNTSIAVMRMAADCVRHGANAADVATQLYRNKSVKALRLWGCALQRLEYHPENDMVVSIITQKDLRDLAVTADEGKGIVNILSQVPECRFALLLTEEADNSVKGSLRSDEGKDTDVARIARILGGGGHRLASGFRLSGRLTKSGDSFRIV